MSLIEEALRKQQERYGKPPFAPHTGPPEPVPVVPPALPEAESEEPAEPAAPAAAAPPRRTWPLLAGIVCAGVLVGGVCIWLFVRGIRLMGTHGAAKPGPAATQVHTTSVAAAAAPLSNAQPARAKSSTAATSGAAKVTAAVILPLSATASSAPPLFASAAGLASGVLENATSPPVVWPHLKLAGIIGGANAGDGAAILNNRVIGIGDQLEGAEVVSITNGGVYLRYKTTTRFLKVGTVTTE